MTCSQRPRARALPRARCGGPAPCRRDQASAAHRRVLWRRSEPPVRRVSHFDGPLSSSLFSCVRRRSHLWPLFSSFFVFRSDFWLSMYCLLACSLALLVTKRSACLSWCCAVCSRGEGCCRCCGRCGCVSRHAVQCRTVCAGRVSRSSGPAPLGVGWPCVGQQSVRRTQQTRCIRRRRVVVHGGRLRAVAASSVVVGSACARVQQRHDLRRAG